MTGIRSVDGSVLEDVNANGNIVDDGIARDNVSVKLYLDDGDGDPDAGDTLVDTTTTDGSGAYSFDNLADGTYFVVVDSKTVTPGQRLQRRPGQRRRLGRADLRRRGQLVGCRLYRQSTGPWSAVAPPARPTTPVRSRPRSMW